MVSPELQSYLAQERAKGRNDPQIRDTLLKAGWTPADVDTALPQASPATPLPVQASNKKWWVLGAAILLLAGIILGTSFLKNTFISSAPPQSGPDEPGGLQAEYDGMMEDEGLRLARERLQQKAAGVTIDIEPWTSRKECGTVPYNALEANFVLHMDGKPLPDRTAAECFAEALVACSPAIVNASNDDTIEVLREDADECIVEFKRRERLRISDTYSSSLVFECRFPQAYIENLYRSHVASWNPDFRMASLPPKTELYQNVLLTPPPGNSSKVVEKIDALTGKAVSIPCNLTDEQYPAK